MSEMGCEARPGPEIDEGRVCVCAGAKGPRGKYNVVGLMGGSRLIEVSESGTR